MNIENIVAKVNELDQLLADSGLFRDSAIEIVTKEDVSPRYEIRICSVVDECEDED